MRPETKTRRVADEIARQVRNSGAEWAFGHPGGEVVVLIDALRQAGVNFVLTHHEATAAFAAGGYAELTGLPGICVSTLGPGATNMVTGVASALLERAPIVAFTGALAESAPAGATHQDLQLNSLFNPVAKSSTYVTDRDPGEATRAAIDLALAERPGPVHLSLASDVAERTLDPARLAELEPSHEPIGPSRRAMKRATEMLAGASRPVLVAGLSSVRHGASDEFRRLASELSAPVAVTPKAKGLIPEEHPLFLGVLDMAGDRLIGEQLAGADLIVAVGCDVVELDRRWDWDAPVIHVDVLPNQDHYYSAEVELVGATRPLLSQLADSVNKSTWTDASVEKFRAELLDYVRPASDSLQPWQVVEATQTRFGDAIATSDVGAHKMIVGQLWNTTAPRRFFMANGLSSMGYSIPTAMAIKLTRPHEKVVAFLGDGGLSMYLGELETLARLGCDLTLVVFADRSLELIARAQEKRGVDTRAVSFENPRFSDLGSAFGISALEVDTKVDLDRALQKSDGSEGIHLIAAHINGDDYRL